MSVDRWFGAAVCLLAALFLGVAIPTIPADWQTGVGTGYFTVGPRLFPYLAGALSLVLGAFLIVRPEGGDRLAAWHEAPVRRNVVSLAALGIAYVAVIGTIGFTLATLVTVAVFPVLFGVRRWVLVGALAVGVAVIIKQVFLRLFSLELPAGVWDLPI